MEWQFASEHKTVFQCTLSKTAQGKKNSQNSSRDQKGMYLVDQNHQKARVVQLKLNAEYKIERYGLSIIWLKFRESLCFQPSCFCCCSRGRRRPPWSWQDPERMRFGAFLLPRVVFLPAPGIENSFWYLELENNQVSTSVCLISWVWLQLILW